MPFNSYNPYNHYWIVAGDETHIWSSASTGYVSETDATYVAWLALGFIPSRIPSEQELADVLAPYGLFVSLATAKLAELRAACDAEIVAGYASSALGASHTYPTNMIDQANMEASVIDSLVPGLPNGWTTPFWAKDGNGVWSMAPHNVTQIQVAGRDVKNGITAARLKLATLSAEVMAATTNDQIQAVVW